MTVNPADGVLCRHATIHMKAILLMSMRQVQHTVGCGRILLEVRAERVMAAPTYCTATARTARTIRLGVRPAPGATAPLTGPAAELGARSGPAYRAVANFWSTDGCCGRRDRVWGRPCWPQQGSLRRHYAFVCSTVQQNVRMHILLVSRDSSSTPEGDSDCCTRIHEGCHCESSQQPENRKLQWSWWRSGCHPAHSRREVERSCELNEGT